jgi:hypothetical protein
LTNSGIFDRLPATSQAREIYFPLLMGACANTDHLPRLAQSLLNVIKKLREGAR